MRVSGEYYRPCHATAMIVIHNAGFSRASQFIFMTLGGKIGVGGSVLIWKRDIVDKERITTD